MAVQRKWLVTAAAYKHEWPSRREAVSDAERLARTGRPADIWGLEERVRQETPPPPPVIHERAE